MRETQLKRFRSFDLSYFTRNVLETVAVSIVLAANADLSEGVAQEIPVAKHYVGRSLAACETIDYRCPAGVEAFQDSEGCGCLMPVTGQPGNGNEAPLAQPAEHVETRPDATVK